MENNEMINVMENTVEDIAVPNATGKRSKAGFAMGAGAVLLGVGTIKLLKWGFKKAKSKIAANREKSAGTTNAAYENDEDAIYKDIDSVE